MIIIEVFKDIDDPRLKSAWDELFARNDYCFQNSHVWCSLWLKHFTKNRRTPYIVAALEEGRIIGLGPFMLERNRLLRELKFIGSGLTDFHEILAVPERNAEVQKAILDWILNNPRYDLINLEQVSDRSPLNPVIREFREFRTRVMVLCPVVNYNSSDWDGYLAKLSRNLRHGWFKKYRRLTRTARIEFVRAFEMEKKAMFLDEIFRLHIKRWKESNAVSKFTVGHMREFISDLAMSAPEVVIFALTADFKLIAYELGFIQKNVYYCWNAGFDPDFGRFSPGFILRGLSMKDMIARGFRKYNDMRGNYDWKHEWMTDDEVLINSQYLARRNPFTGLLAERYYLKWKWRLKGLLTGLIRHPAVQKLLIRNRY